MHRFLVLAALVVGLRAAAVNIEYVAVRDAGNPADTAANCIAPDCGSVPYDYAIARYEVTNAQYAEFLSAKALSDPLGLYSPSMGSDPTFGGITQSGSDGSYSYAAKAGFENEPVVFVSFHDALRFANWLHNGQGSGDTETGAYTITADGITNNTITRNVGEATVFLPSESEWYKAAYYSPGGTYFEYPTGTDTETSCVAPASDTGNSANCDGAVNALTDVGAYALSLSPYGTSDQGGNVAEWNEQISFNGDQRGFRGGGWDFAASSLGASGEPPDFVPTNESDDLGFRVARSVPEPAQGFLVLTGGVVLAVVRKRRG